MEPHCACIINSNDDVVKLCAPHQDVVDAAVAAEREACAILADMYQDIARDSEFDTGVLHARAGIAKIIRSRRNTV